MRVLVTGGTGYLGTAIVKALQARGHAPVVYARNPQAGAGVEAIAGDVTDKDALARAARGVDAICHSAAMVSIWERDPSRFDAVNVGGLRHAIAAAAAAGHDRFVYTSSFLALPPLGRTAPLASNDYQRTKAEADRVADEAARDGFPITRIYPGVIYGPGDARESNLVGRLIRDQLTARMPVAVGGDRIWSFSWIEDVAAAHVAALERGGPAARFMAGGENLPQRRVFEIVRERTGARMPTPLPAWMARAVGAVEVARARVTGRAPLVTPATVAIFEHDWPLDSRDAIAALNYRVTPLVDGLEQLLSESSF
ncbi:MAG: NAD-dependent epimerase/dehydratase family protein [Acidobacteriota bacterium]|nr:NAD-dependent epimerase/dehydratase family protein [Acidobacteriota bacterium]